MIIVAFRLLLGYLSESVIATIYDRQGDIQKIFRLFSYPYTD